MQRVWIETEFARCENVGAGLTSVDSESMRTRQQVWTDVDGHRVDDQPIVQWEGGSVVYGRWNPGRHQLTRGIVCGAADLEDVRRVALSGAMVVRRLLG